MKQRSPSLLVTTLVSVFAALVASPATASAQVTTYGSGVNPPGSLVVLSGVPEVGSTLTLGVANTAVANPGPSLALLILATAPASGYPAGLLLPGFGLAGSGAPGELLLSAGPPDPLVTLGPVFSAGLDGMPASFSLPIPVISSLMGVSVYAQGGLVALAQANAIGLTEGLRIQIQFAGPDPAVFAFIQAGTFQMGSDAAGGGPYFGGSEQPVHEVTLSKPFWMSRYEVTQAEYEALMGTNPSQFLGANRPVERVSWLEAVAYCNTMTVQQATLGKVPLGYQYRLPTEAEWEYACRAGTTTEFSFGPELFCIEARFILSYHSTPAAGCDNPSGTVSVGSYAPNAWGLYDMHGNVYEWCLDSYTSYTASADVDPYHSVGPFRVFRGGGWGGDSANCRSARRYGHIPSYTDNNLGFRVVLAPLVQ